MKNKELNKDLLFLIIGIFVFCIMLLLFSILIITTIDSIMLRNCVFIISSIVIVIIGLLLFFIMNKNRKYIVVLYILSGVIFIIMLSLIFTNLIGTDLVDNCQGNNIYNSQYVKSIGSKGYNSIDEGVTNMLEKYGEDEYEELYRVSDENYIWVFEKGNCKIIELEFYEEDSKYFYSGSTVLAYDSTISTLEHSDIETIRADVAHSIFSGMKEENIIYPVWGVSEYSKIENVSINNVKIDFVEKLMDGNGSEYYFWIIVNIGKIENVEDIKKIKISGI